MGQLLQRPRPNKDDDDDGTEMEELSLSSIRSTLENYDEEKPSLQLRRTTKIARKKVSGDGDGLEDNDDRDERFEPAQIDKWYKNDKRIKSLKGCDIFTYPSPPVQNIRCGSGVSQHYRSGKYDTVVIDETDKWFEILSRPDDQPVSNSNKKKDDFEGWNSLDICPGKTILYHDVIDLCISMIYFMGFLITCAVLVLIVVGTYRLAMPEGDDPVHGKDLRAVEKAIASLEERLVNNNLTSYTSSSINN